MKTEECGKPPPPGKRRLRMRRPVDAIRLLNRVINDLVNGEMETEKARALIYAASTLGKLFETSELDERVRRLEERSPQK